MMSSTKAHFTNAAHRVESAAKQVEAARVTIQDAVNQLSQINSEVGNLEINELMALASKAEVFAKLLEKQSTAMGYTLEVL